MAGLYTILNTGRTGLSTHQIGVETVSHNIANVNTPGYSRQRAILENNDPFVTRNGQIGMGVDVLTIDRMNGSYINRQMVQKKAELGYYDKSYEVLKEVESTFTDQSSADIQTAMVAFFDSFRTLSTRPDDVALRENVKAKASILVDRFGRVSSDLDRIRNEMNPEIDSRLKQVNVLTEEISKLNAEIAVQEFSGNQANDLRDRQELKVRELAQLVKVNTFTDNKGFLNVWTDSGEPLVSGKDAYKMITISQPDGLYHIGVQRDNAGVVDVTDDLRGGELAALIDVRDNKITAYQARLDSLALTTAQQVNAIHSTGYGLDLVQRDFFVAADITQPISASNIAIHADIINSGDAIAAGQINDAVSIRGDNRNALAISALVNNTTFFGTGETIANHYQQTVSNIGHDVSGTQGKLNYAKDEDTQLNNFRESVCGVNMDEELIELNKFQKAYEASSRIIQTANSMFDTLLGIMTAV